MRRVAALFVPPRYPEYEFISDNSISWSAGLHNRYTENSLRGVILDIHFLSQTDFLVCTFSSQVLPAVRMVSGSQAFVPRSHAEDFTTSPSQRRLSSFILNVCNAG